MSSQWTTVNNQKKPKASQYQKASARPDTRISTFLALPKNSNSIDFYELKQIGRQVDRSCTIYYHRDKKQYEIKARNEDMIGAAKMEINKKHSAIENEIEQHRENETHHKESIKQKSLEFNSSQYPSLTTQTTSAPKSIWNNSAKLSEVKMETPIVQKKQEQPKFQQIKTQTKKEFKPFKSSLVNEITNNMRNARYKRASFLPDNNYRETLDDDYDSDYDFDNQKVTYWDESVDYESE